MPTALPLRPDRAAAAAAAAAAADPLAAKADASPAVKLALQAVAGLQEDAARATASCLGVPRILGATSTLGGAGEHVLRDLCTGESGVEVGAVGGCEAGGSDGAGKELAAKSLPKALKGMSPALVAKIRAKEAEKKAREAAEAAADAAKKAAMARVLASSSMASSAVGRTAPVELGTG